MPQGRGGRVLHPLDTVSRGTEGHNVPSMFGCPRFIDSVREPDDRCKTNHPVRTRIATTSIQRRVFTGPWLSVPLPPDAPLLSKSPHPQHMLLFLYLHPYLSIVYARFLSPFSSAAAIIQGFDWPYRRSLGVGALPHGPSPAHCFLRSWYQFRYRRSWNEYESEA